MHRIQVNTQAKTIQELYESFMVAYNNAPFYTHLRWYASRSCVRHIVELGVKQGGSTAALLTCRPETLTSYDIRPDQCDEQLFLRLAGPTKWKLIKADSTQERCGLCDMLVIDTVHEQAHIKRELELHAPMCRHYIVCHDTNYPKGTTDQSKMLRATIKEYARQNGWAIEMNDPRATGTMALARV